MGRFRLVRGQFINEANVPRLFVPDESEILEQQIADHCSIDVLNGPPFAKRSFQNAVVHAEED